MKLTRQGVRDLDSLPSKPKGVKLVEPPKLASFCKHIRIKDMESGDSMCLDCPLVWDWNGIPY
jgi:hypothetical protein